MKHGSANSSQCGKWITLGLVSLSLLSGHTCSNNLLDQRAVDGQFHIRERMGGLGGSVT